MNAIHGKWDEELLAGVLDYLADAGVAHLTGFTTEEFARYTGELAAQAAPKEPPIIAPTGDTTIDPTAIESADIPGADTDEDFTTVACPNCRTRQPA
jgi:hypothetical protein